MKERFNFLRVSKDLIDMYMSDQADKIAEFNIEESAVYLYEYSYLWQYRDYLECCKQNDVKPNNKLLCSYVNELKRLDPRVDEIEAIDYFNRFSCLSAAALADYGFKLVTLI